MYSVSSYVRCGVRLCVRDYPMCLCALWDVLHRQGVFGGICVMRLQLNMKLYLSPCKIIQRARTNLKISLNKPTLILTIPVSQ